MNTDRRDRLATQFLDAWNSQDVERVLDCYTDDLRYRDPNTRGEVAGRDAMRRYLTRLFAGWRMTWAKREVYDLAGHDGVALLWHATFRRRGPDAPIVEIDGMDLVVLDGDRVARNEVHFDRAPLAALETAATR
ncbi:MAG TPA: nuclear transport factor 2 family protein [Steroidobacteraceae bacterium]|nr:nuclear transport factor 2 family protein [Steroidobacteraceae bacterium]